LSALELQVPLPRIHSLPFPKFSPLKSYLHLGYCTLRIVCCLKIFLPSPFLLNLADRNSCDRPRSKPLPRPFFHFETPNFNASLSDLSFFPFRGYRPRELWRNPVFLRRSPPICRGDHLMKQTSLFFNGLVSWDAPNLPQ